jgi:hypothetical protein
VTTPAAKESAFSLIDVSETKFRCDAQDRLKKNLEHSVMTGGSDAETGSQPSYNILTISPIAGQAAPTGRFDALRCYNPRRPEVGCVKEDRTIELDETIGPR